MDGLEKRLRNTPWGMVTDGLNQPPWGLICPICMSYVPVTFTNQAELAYTPKDAHIEWHLRVGN